MEQIAIQRFDRSYPSMFSNTQRFPTSTGFDRPASVNQSVGFSLEAASNGKHLCGLKAAIRQLSGVNTSSQTVFFDTIHTPTITHS